jgi:hypothetical protein
MAENDRNINISLFTNSLKLFAEVVSNWPFCDFTFPILSGRKCEQNMIIGNAVGEEKESRASSEYLVLMINNSNCALSSNLHSYYLPSCSSSQLLLQSLVVENKAGESRQVVKELRSRNRVRLL